jgi:AAA family ATPase
LICEKTEGCSGAEITSLCQEAAILTMQNNMSALYVSPIYLPQILLIEYDQVPHDAFVTAAKRMTRQITPAVLQKYIKWRDGYHS